MPKPRSPSRARSRRNAPSRLFGGIGLVAALVLLIGVSITTDWPWYVLWLAVLTPVTFLFYGFDKLQSRGSGLRVPELVLLGLSLAGGFVGGFLAMLLVRHKTQHRYFWLVQWVGLLVYAGVVWWVTRQGW